MENRAIARRADQERRALSAYETGTGRLLWQARLPAGGQSTPMSFVSSRTGRQYVVIAATGHDALATRKGDYLIAYALPAKGF